MNYFPPEYFAKRLELDKRVCAGVMPKACHDCAVVDGMYAGISDDLKQCDLELQKRYSMTWFCHNSPDMACRGNIDNLGIIGELDAKQGVGE